MQVPRDGDVISPGTRCVQLQGRRGVIVRSPPPGTCTWCGKAVPPGRRRTWCSQWCVDAYQVTQPGEQRRLLRKRDRGVCAVCGVDCGRRRKALVRWRRLVVRRTLGREIAHMARVLALRGLPCSERQLRSWVHRRELWDVDHRVPIWEGGHPYDLRNLRTLCPWCHDRETTEGAARRAEQRRGAQDPGDQTEIRWDHG